MSLLDLAYMAVWGAGWMLGPAFGVGPALALGRGGNGQAERIARRDARISLAFLLALWQIYYFLFMIPKAGIFRFLRP